MKLRPGAFVKAIDSYDGKVLISGKEVKLSRAIQCGEILRIKTFERCPIRGTVGVTFEGIPKMIHPITNTVINYNLDGFVVVSPITAFFWKIKNLFSNN